MTLEMRIKKLIVKVEDEIHNVTSDFDKVTYIDDDRHLEFDSRSHQRFSYPVLENTAFVFTSTATLRYWLLSKTKQDRALISAILFIAEPPEPPHAAGPSNWRQRYREEKENVLRALHTSIKLVFRDELEVRLNSFRSLLA